MDALFFRENLLDVIGFLTGTGGDAVVDGAAATSLLVLSVVYRRYIIMHQGLQGRPEVRLHLCGHAALPVRHHCHQRRHHGYDVLLLRPSGTGLGMSARATTYRRRRWRRSLISCEGSRHVRKGYDLHGLESALISREGSRYVRKGYDLRGLESAHHSLTCTTTTPPTRV